MKLVSDLINALANGSLDKEHVRFIATNAKRLAKLGLTISPLPRGTKMQRFVAANLNRDVSAVLDFMENNKALGAEYRMHKIPLIKAFREFFRGITGEVCSLRDSKWGVEMLYENTSLMDAPNSAVGPFDSFNG